MRLHFRETIELLVEAIVRHQKSSALKAIMAIVMYGQRLPRLFSWRSGMMHERASIGSQA